MREYESFSSLNTYRRCGMQYYFMYCEGIKAPPSVALIQGSSIHRGQEFNFKQKIESKTDLPLDDVLDCVSDEFEARKTEVEKWENTDPGKAKDETICVAEHVHTTHNPTIQPVEVEVEYLTECEGVQLKTIIDLIDIDGFIRDVKVVGRAKSQSDADNDMQLTIYSYVTGLKNVVFDCFIKARESEMRFKNGCLTVHSKKKPRVVTLKSTRTEKDWQRLANIVPALLKGIKNEVFLPADPTWWGCSERFCGYWHICKYGGK